jgi:hypothetical protein
MNTLGDMLSYERVTWDRPVSTILERSRARPTVPVDDYHKEIEWAMTVEKGEKGRLINDQHEVLPVRRGD